jgi:8-oxo-dGTP pyrophosphatase MutT (NUDIX family)
MIGFRKNKILGTFLFYILWPFVWVYAPIRVRVRVIIKYKDEVLVVKNWIGPNIWQLPGGGTKFSESVIETSVREIKEELNLQLNPKSIRSLSDTAQFVHQFGLNYRFKYALVILDKKPKLKISPELTDVNWIKFKEIELPSEVLATL